MAMVQINLRVTPEQLAKIDADRGLIPRNVWIRARLELADSAAVAAREVESDAGRNQEESRQAADSPPESYRQGYGPDVTRLRSSGQVKAGVNPIPK